MSQKKFTNATGNWTVGQNDEINYAGKAKLEGAVQATDFLDADGNSIIGASEYVNVDTGLKLLKVGTLPILDPNTSGGSGYCVAVGMQANFGGYVHDQSVGIGVDAKAVSNAVAVGLGTEARPNAVAIGRSAQAWDKAMALGSGTWATHDYSVAIGKGAKTEEPNQVMFGATPDDPYSEPVNLKTYGAIQAAQFELPPPPSSRVDSKITTGKFYIGERRESPSNADRTQLEIGHSNNVLLKLDNVHNWVKLEQGHLIFSRMSMQKTTSDGGNANDSVGFVWDQNKVVNIDWQGIVTAGGFKLPDPTSQNVSNSYKFGIFSVGEKFQSSSYPDRRVLAFTSGNHSDEVLSLYSQDGLVKINKGKLGISRMSLQKTTSDGGFADDSLGIRWDNSKRLFDIDWQGNAIFQGTIKANGTRPLSTRSDLINTLSTLSDAIRNESTVEGMREAIRNAITGLIVQLEADQT